MKPENLIQPTGAVREAIERCLSAYFPAPGKQHLPRLTVRHGSRPAIAIHR